MLLGESNRERAAGQSAFVHAHCGDDGHPLGPTACKRTASGRPGGRSGVYPTPYPVIGWDRGAGVLICLYSWVLALGASKMSCLG